MFSSLVSQLQANDPRKEVKAQGRNGRDSSLNCSKIGKYARNKPLFFFVVPEIWGAWYSNSHTPHNTKHVLHNGYKIKRYGNHGVSSM